MKECDLALKRAIKTNLSHERDNFAMLRNTVTTMLRKSFSDHNQRGKE